MNEQSNIYLPHLMVIEKITHEAPGSQDVPVKNLKTRRKEKLFTSKPDSSVNTLRLVKGSQLSVLLRRLLVKDISSVHSVRQDG